ncbi:DUF1750-domain-containing protein [Myriangium duriaei CBS 260.36]|uniref:DUF1750-domain-containing protein n=1 Tax=Myriangium duriaei CBS 260.36 TaxID=1168546 RepID=A0A9P4J5N8_9PEZI|nr:DUF1750-domain-containing protein [Myriangium duriaei CBS 260.36]
MQDPSNGIPKDLIQHVHLICTQRFPYAPRLQLNQAYQYLFEAPKLVKQHAAMSWQYLTAPPDGTLFLTWASPSVEQFPSDGYIWAGPEERMMSDIGGYTIEIAVQHAGFRPHIDTLTNHQRRRYRLVQKNPNVNAAPPDRNLWLVHYSPAEPTRTMPASQVAMSRLQQIQFQQRSFIESQGQLEHREFMLHDRERWPTLRFAGNGRGIQAVQGYPQRTPGAPPNAMPHMANQRFAPQQYQQQQSQAAVGPSPAKRQRTSVGGAAPAAAHPPLVEYHDIEAEEEYAFGDYLDTMNQREVSRARYMVHHEWMEEVFSSPYMTQQIAPAYLGFGLMGELSGLTKDIFETVSDAVQLYNNTEKITADKMQVGGSVPAEKVQDFEKRVSEYLDQGHAEIKKMKEEHARKVEEMRKGRTLSKAEKRLRNARWTTGEAGEPAILNGLVSGKGAKEDAEQIVQDVRTDLAKEIVTQPLVHVVDRGGLRERVEQQPEPPTVNDSGPSDFELQQRLLQQRQQQHMQPRALEGITGAAAQQSANIPHPQQAPTSNVPATSAPPQQQQQQHTTVPAQAVDTSAELAGFDPDEHMDTLDESNFELEGMDLDIGDGPDFNFGDDPLGGSGNGTPQQQAQQAIGTTTAPQPASTAASSAPAPTAATPAAEQPVAADDTTFDDFTAGIDFGTGGDDDVDLGDLGMDNSAFGDAFHQDTPQGEGEP